MLNPIQSYYEYPARVNTLDSAPQLIHYQSSTLSSKQENASYTECFFNYFKRLFQSFIGVCGALLDLFLFIFCCKTAHEIDWRLPVDTDPDDPLKDTLKPLTEDEMKTISYLINTIANTSYFNLLTLQTNLEKKGKEIKDVHPFRFFEYALKHPTLKKDLIKLSNEFIGFAWKSFVSGLVKRFEEAKKNNDIQPHLEGFLAKRQHLRRALLDCINGNSQANTDNWAKFVKLLAHPTS